MILYAALVILAMVSLVTVSLLFAMSAEAAAYNAGVNEHQAYMAALSGVQRAISLVAADPENLEAWWDDEGAFRDQLVWEDGANRWYFTVYAADPAEPDTLRYGVTDESGRININSADRATLLALPDMTEALVDSLMDYRDDDSETRGQGAEQDYYSQLAYPYAIRDGEFGTPEELLLVKGFDATIVFGEDANRNGILDPNENDGDESFPFDNGDGVLDRGLAGVATSFTVERHRSSRGTMKIDLNGPDVQAITSGLPDQTRQYIEAVRSDGGQFGHPSELLEAAYDGPNGRVESGVGPDDIADLLDRYSAAASYGVDPLGLGGSLANDLDDLDDLDDPPVDDGEPSRMFARGGGGTLADRGGLPREVLEFERSITGVDPGGLSDRGGAISGRDGRMGRPEGRGIAGGRGGRRISGRGGRRGGADGAGRGGGGRGGTGGYAGTDAAGVSPTAGLVNLNTASADVLAAVGDMGPDLAGRIVEHREQLEPDQLGTTAWLLTEGLLDSDTFKQIAPMLTVRSEQYRIRCVGYGLPTGQFCVLEAVVDLSVSPARIVYLRRLTRLGAPFALTGPDELLRE